MTDLTMVSLFDGIGGFPLAFSRAGVRTVATVEIDPAAAGVVRDRMPGIPHFDDVTEVSADDLRAAGFVPERGVLTAGWPCQDLSLAGLRAGLDGARSGLFWQVVRLASGLRPRWLVLENVPGLLSAVCPGRSEDRTGSGQGRLFGDDEPDGLTHGRGACPGGCMAAHGGAMGLVLGALGGLGYGFAYRVLDAQHFGVPQRRRRVVIVGCLGDGAAPAEVLLEPASLRGDSAAGGAARARTARVLALGAGGGGGNGHGGPVSALTANMAGGGGGADDNTAQGGHLIASAITARESKGPDSDATTTLIVPAVTAKWAKGSGGPSGDEAQNLIGFDAAQITSGENRSNPRPGDPQPPPAATGAPHVAYQCHGGNVGPMGTLRGDGSLGGGVPFTPLVPVAFGHTNGIDPQASTEATPTLRNGGAGGAVMVDHNSTTDALTVSPALDTESGLFPNRQQGGPMVMETAAVRRLTPTECERLQGYPDGWTAISDGRPQADSARYRQLGNSIAIPVFTWVALGIADYEAGR